MSAPAKLTNRGLSGMQGYVLDAAVPLVSILESARNGTLTTKDTAESAQQALKLISNALAHLSAERRRKAATCLNKELSTLVDQEDTFVDAAPFLFGSSFQQKMKEHMEAIRNLKQASTSFGHGQSFQRGHPLSPRAVAATGAGDRENSRLENIKCMPFKQTINVLNTTNVQSTVNVTQSKCLGPTLREAKVLIPPLLTSQGPVHTPAQSLVQPNQQVSEVIPRIHLESTQQLPEKPLAEPNQHCILGLPVVHLSLSLANTPWVQLSQRGILPMAETICQSTQTFAGRVSLFRSNWEAITQEP